MNANHRQGEAYVSAATDRPVAGSTTRPGAPSVRRSRRRGVVMVMTLLAVILLAALIFYVMNVGRTANARILTQNSADAAAAAGAGWIARQMNLVAMNNVEMARQIALINVLDSMPLALDLTVKDDAETDLDDMEALRVAVAAQLRQGVSDVWFHSLLQSMAQTVEQDNVNAQELDNLFRNDPDAVINMTHYDVPGGHGQIWRAMMALDRINQASMQNLAATATLNGEVGGAADWRTGGGVQGDAGDEPRAAAGRQAVAVVTALPYKRGTFDDFERPVRYGLLPRDVDDKQYNRGPFDVLFGWRYTDGGPGDPGRIPGPEAPPLTSPPSQPRDPTRYTVYGTQTWMIDQVPTNDYERLRYWVATLTAIKLRYIWPAPTSALSMVTDPAWEVDIASDGERARDANSDSVYSLVDDDASQIKETMYIVAEMKTRVKGNGGDPGSQGITWNYIRRPGLALPFLLRRGGWHDARNGPPMNVQSTDTIRWRKVNSHIWRLSATYMTNPDDATLGGDPEIGLPPRRSGTGPDGNPIYAAQKVYWEQDYMLVGCNVGPEIEVRNPYAGFDPGSPDAPAPMDLDHTLVSHDNAQARRDYLTVLSIVRQPDRALFWPSRFDAGKPYPYTVAVAQARVFNNHSWDLWTQMWHAQLEPVTDYDDWLGKLSAMSSDPPYVQEFYRHLASIEPMAKELLTH